MKTPRRFTDKEKEEIKSTIGEEQQDLLRKYKQTGDKKLKNKLIMLMRPFIIYKAKQYCTYNAAYQFADAAQSAALGLSKAIDRVDINKIDSFLSYVTYYMLSEMQNYLSISRMGYNKNMKRQRRRMKRAVNKLKERGEILTIEVIAEEMGAMQNTVVGLMERNMVNSLDKSFIQGGEVLHEIITGSKINRYDIYFITKLMARYLTRQNYKMVMLYFIGEENYREIGKRLGLSYETIRKKIKQSLQKVKSILNR